MASKLRDYYETILFGRDTPWQSADTGPRPQIETSRNNSSVDEKTTAKTAESPTGSVGSLPSISTALPPPPPTLDAIFSAAKSIANRDGQVWKPTFWQLKPLLGLFALCVTVFSVFSSFLVLFISDGEPITSWTLAPTVYLAIFTALGNSALVLARSLAVPVSWWYNASRGASIRMLERQWQVSHSLFRALLHGRYPSLLSVACIVASIAIIDGALLQRASTVIRATTSSQVTLNLLLPPELPTGFSGTLQYDQLTSNEISYKTLSQWTEATPIQLKVPDCVGTCRTTVQGPGLSKRYCGHEQIWQLTQEILSSKTGSWGSWHGYADAYGPSNGWQARNSIFYVSLALGNDDKIGESMEISTGIASWSRDADGNYSGQYVSQACVWSPAILEYDVIIKDDIVSIDGSAAGATVIRLANNTQFLNTRLHANPAIAQYPTITSFTEWLTIWVQANASAVLEKGLPLYTADPSTWTPEVLKHSTASGENMSFSNPTPSIVSRYNEMMFRGAIAAGVQWPNITKLIDKDVSIHQTVLAHQDLEQNVYHTDLRWFAGAAVLQLTAVVFILQMFWGYWTLSPSPTLSPFEFALAFDSPMFRHVNSASGAKGIVDQCGDMQMKFGLVRQEDEAETEGPARRPTFGRLGLAQSDRVERPSPRMRFPD